MERDETFLASLVTELSMLPRETEWVEFKLNSMPHNEIGEYVSALANSAALLDRPSAYLIWGVRDGDHAIEGTTFDPWRERVGNEELENWLLRLLEPSLHLKFKRVSMAGRLVVVLEVPRASYQPVRFKGQEFIRVGSYKRNLKDFPDKERALWRTFDRTPFEAGLARVDATEEDVVQLLDYPKYFELIERPLPVDRAGILEALAHDRLIQNNDAGGWDVTNLGAILLAKRLDAFPQLRRKAVRIVFYEGRDRTRTQRERQSTSGYASGFEGMLSYIYGALPGNEVIRQALRTSVPMFPELAVRELVANALIHQDFFLSGAGPIIEVFADRMEITNPGQPLIDPLRFMDAPPRSRNDALAALMRRFRICEERGSGIDKVVSEVELYQLPAPLFEVPEQFTRVVLFAHKDLRDMNRDDRVRACYLHASLKRVMGDYLTNASLRDRFGVDEKNKAAVSRYIREAVEEGVIKPFDKDAARRMMKYIPFWA